MRTCGTVSSSVAHFGHDVDTVPNERRSGRDDHVVWDAAQADGRFLITQDLDFSDTRRYSPGTRCGLLLVRLGQPGREALFERLSTLLQTEDVEGCRGCIVTATQRKVRVKRPTPG